MKKTLLLIIALAAFSANSQNIFKDDFAGYTITTPLDGQGVWSNNSSNAGGTGGFPASSFAKVIGTASTYTGYGTSINSVEIKPADGCGRGFTAVTSGEIYVAFVLNLSNSFAINNSDFIRVMSGNNFNTALRLFASPSAGAFFLTTEKNGIKVATTLSYNYNQDHLVVVKYTLGTGANDDIITLYVNPVFANGEPAVNSSINNSGTDFTGTIGLDRFCIRQNGNAIPLGKIGLVSVSTTWAGLSFVPLANEQFAKSNFEINASQANQGLLQIKSNINLKNANLNIYDIQGRMLENKTISLTENNNEIVVKPISNSGIYIVEIVSGDKKIAQKIAIK